MLLTVELRAVAEPRAHPRHAVSAAAAIRGTRVRTLASVTDLSRVGARLVTQEPLAAGAQLTIKLPFIDAVHANVIWARRCEAGCRFDEPLPAALFDATGRYIR